MKERCKPIEKQYRSVSLNKSFISLIGKHIQDKPQYRSIADYVRVSVINQMNYEKNINR